VDRKRFDRSVVSWFAHRFSLREGPVGREGEPYARLATFDPFVKTLFVLRRGDTLLRHRMG
jgi:hypothetical protein